MSEEKNSQINIHISSGTMVRGIIFGLVLYGFFALSDLVLVLMTAVILATAIEPFTKWLTDRRIPRVIAVLLIYVSIFAIIGFIVYIFLPPIMDDIVALGSRFPGYLRSIDISGIAWGSAFKNIPFEQIAPFLKYTASGFSGGFLQTASLVFGGLFSFALIVIFSFYLAVQERGIENILRILTPLRYEQYVLDLWSRSRRKIGYWLQGHLLLGAIIGVFVYLGLSVLGVQYALSLGLIAVVLELIPVFGPIMAAIPAVAIAFSQDVGLGFGVIAFYVIIQQFENQLIFPLVVRKIVGVPPLVSIIALIIGGRLAGFLGIIISVPLATVLMELIDDIEKKKYPKISQ